MKRTASVVVTVVAMLQPETKHAHRSGMDVPRLRPVQAAERAGSAPTSGRFG